MAPGTPSDIFERFLKKYEKPKITFHQIRHTSVSLLIIYIHVFQSIETQAVEKMNEIFEIAWKKNPLAKWLEDFFEKYCYSIISLIQFSCTFLIIEIY